MKKNELNSHFYEIAGELLNDKHSLQFLTKGYSMFPTLLPGDKAVIEKCDISDYQPGDIVVFKSKAILIGHRIIKKTESSDGIIFTTRGDNSPVTDKTFTEKDILGKIKSFTRNGKEISCQKANKTTIAFFALHFPKILLFFSKNTLRTKLRLKKVLNHFESLKENISYIIKGSKKLFYINALISILQGLIPFVIIVLFKYLIDFLTINEIESPEQKLYFALILTATAVSFASTAVLNEVRTYYSEKLSQSVTKHIYSKLQSHHIRLHLSNYENPEKQDKLHRAVQEASFRPVKIINSLLNAIKSTASAIFLLALFISIRWYILLILILAISPGILIRLKFSRKHYQLKETHSTKEREMFYFNRILTGFPFAKELKLFGYSKFFLKKFNHTQNQIFNDKIKLRKAEMQLTVAAQLFAVLLIFACMGFVSYLKINGEITIGTLVLFFFAFQRGYAVLNDFFKSFTQISEDNVFLKDFTGFLNDENNLINELENPADFSLNKDLRIENVSFAYETSKREALKNINLTIPAGKTVAFVGANGSGKTSLIKLICGFYQPNMGRILFDKIDANDIGQKNICKNISAVFQDFALYNIPAIDNIFLGDITESLDAEKAKQAAQKADIDQVLSNLSQGYDTMLGNLFRSGEEMSIGQWQKIAIARAFYRDAPLLLLDEPSSALDANSENQILQKLKKLAENKTAIIISHRLSSVRWADFICVFDKGELVEKGTHDELLALKGKYFELSQVNLPT
jgi:ATP-binding cassette subfamily B protein